MDKNRKKKFANLWSLLSLCSFVIFMFAIYVIMNSSIDDSPVIIFPDVHHISFVVFGAGTIACLIISFVYRVTVFNLIVLAIYDIVILGSLVYMMYSIYYAFTHALYR